MVAEARYDSAYTFIFSPRPGTRAALMRERWVDEGVVGERFERLKVVVERSALAKHEARIGLVEEALVEGPSKRDPSMLTGRTTQGKLVHFAPVGEVAPGSFASVRIDGAAPHHLRGTLLSVEPPSPRRRTPLKVTISA
ncbi:MAG: TRAM domain-containing protein [Acidimicrobiales bacterium]